LHLDFIPTNSDTHLLHDSWSDNMKQCVFVLVSLYTCVFFYVCWSHSASEFMLNSSIVSYHMQYTIYQDSRNCLQTGSTRSQIQNAPEWNSVQDFFKDWGSIAVHYSQTWLMWYSASGCDVHYSQTWLMWYSASGIPILTVTFVQPDVQFQLSRIFLHHLIAWSSDLYWTSWASVRAITLTRVLNTKGVLVGKMANSVAFTLVILRMVLDT